jgi:hypothetical protein
MRQCCLRRSTKPSQTTPACSIITRPSSIVHPLLYVLLLLFDDMLYCVTNGPKVEAS